MNKLASEELILEEHVWKNVITTQRKPREKSIVTGKQKCFHYQYKPSTVHHAVSYQMS